MELSMIHVLPTCGNICIYSITCTDRINCIDRIAFIDRINCIDAITSTDRIYCITCIDRIFVDEVILAYHEAAYDECDAVFNDLCVNVVNCIV